MDVFQWFWTIVLVLCVLSVFVAVWFNTKKGGQS